MSDVALEDDAAPIKSFFLKLVGRAPEQIRAQQEFKENLRKVDDQEDILDDILSGFDRINETAKNTTRKNKDMHRTLRLSMDPPPTPMPDSKTS